MNGRPSKMTKDTLEKLECAFLLGHTDEEACLIAEIDPKTLYTYCRNHVTFSRKKELLKQNLKLRARRNIAQKIEDGDVDLSKWYLERKAREEFSPRQDSRSEVTLSTNPAMDALAESLKQIAESARRDYK